MQQSRRALGARVTDAEVRSTLAANSDNPTLTAAIDTVLIDGWATRPAPNRLALIPDSCRRLAAVAQRVDAFRELSMTGIASDEYRTTVGVLERMTRNIETATASTTRHDDPRQHPAHHAGPS